VYSYITHQRDSNEHHEESPIEECLPRQRFSLFSVHPNKFLDNTSTLSFQILSNSSPTYHHIIQRYIVLSHLITLKQRKYENLRQIQRNALFGGGGKIFRKKSSHRNINLLVYLLKIFYKFATTVSSCKI
jgi:hypothetical protein